MPALPAERLVVVFHDDSRRRYRDVSYCLWAGGVTVYRDGVEIARHDDVLETHTDSPQLAVA